MAQYKIPEKVRSNIGTLIDGANILGKDSAKTVAIYQILGDAKIKDDVYNIPDELKTFLLETISEVTIKGKFAFAVLEVQVALRKVIEKAPVTPKNSPKNPPPSPPPSKGKVSKKKSK